MVLPIPEQWRAPYGRALCFRVAPKSLTFDVRGDLRLAARRPLHGEVRGHGIDCTGENGAGYKRCEHSAADSNEEQKGRGEPQFRKGSDLRLVALARALRDKHWHKLTDLWPEPRAGDRAAQLGPLTI